MTWYFSEPISALLYTIGVAVGIVVGGLLGAIFLRLAAKTLGLQEIPFLTALKIAILTALLNFSLSFSISFSVSVVSGIINKEPTRYTGFALATPIYFLYLAVIGSLLAACLLRRLLPQQDGERIPFGDAVLVSSLAGAYGLLSLFLLVLLLSFVMVAATG